MDLHQNPRAFFLLNIAVGPDGNIYGVASEGLGTFSLTPGGVLRWNVPELYRRPIVETGDIVFGPNGAKQQLYFYTNHHTLTYDLNGNLLNSTMPTAQPRVSLFDASVHIVNQALSPGGQLLWTADSLALETTFTLASDGTHYGIDGQFQTLRAITPAGALAWSLPFSTAEYNAWVGANRQSTLLASAGPTSPTFFCAA